MALLVFNLGINLQKKIFVWDTLVLEMAKIQHSDAAVTAQVKALCSFRDVKEKSLISHP